MSAPCKSRISTPLLIGAIAAAIATAAVQNLGAVSTDPACGSPAAEILPFPQFVHGIETARASDYVGHRDCKVSGPDAFAEMTQYLLDRYAGETVAHSYVSAGDIYDCVPYGQQPGARAYSPPIAVQSLRTSEPDPSIAGGEAVPVWDRTTCPDGTISWRRLTLGELASYSDLTSYFQQATSTIP